MRLLDKAFSSLPVGIKPGIQKALNIMCCAQSSVVSDSFRSHGPSRLLCPWEFSGQEYWSELPCSPPGDLPNPGVEPRSPTRQTDCLLIILSAPFFSLFSLINFSPIMGYIFFLLCIPGNNCRLHVRYCEFYFIGCWMFLYFFYISIILF